MKAAIRYYTKTGNTKKLADSISAVLDIPAQTVDTPVDEPVDVLFLGSSVYAAGVDEKVKGFIAALDPGKVKKIVNFSTAALLPSTYSQVSKLAAQKNIPVESREYHCRGKFKFMHSNHPDQEDLKKVQAFALSVVKNELPDSSL